MGNVNTASQMSNYSSRNIRVFVSEKALEVDDFIAPQSGGGGDQQTLSELSGGKTFSSRKDDVRCVRVLASQTQQVPWDARHFLSVFVEDEGDENVCAKQIVHNMSLSAPVTLLLYDV